jgi:protein SCO1/2
MLGSVWSSASAGGVGVAATATTPGSRGSFPYAERLPNLVLKTHEGKNVRFYDDLIKDKIVLINFMYVTCDGR